MPIQVLIGREQSDHVKLVPTRREFPGVQDYWDGNWVFTDVDIRAGGYRGSFEAILRTDEFIRLHRGLRLLNETLIGEATFESMERWLSIRLVGDGKGHISASCEARDAPGAGNHLVFRFEFDQTDVPRIVTELEGILTTYPVVGASR